MDNSQFKLPQKARDLLSGDVGEMMLHKELRDDQEGTLEITRSKRVSSKEDAREVLTEMYQEADKRDKIFVSQKNTPDGTVWEICRQTRHYINR
jgi:hypothetical protein